MLLSPAAWAKIVAPRLRPSETSPPLKLLIESLLRDVPPQQPNRLYWHNMSGGADSKTSSLTVTEISDRDWKLLEGDYKSF